MSRRPEAILVDSGFFFALFDPRDPWHTQAKSKAEWVEAFRVIVPWPILYETVNTRLARRPDRVARFERILRRPDTELLDDSPYRLDAYENTLARAKAQRQPASLVDSVLQAVLGDVNVRVDAMLTFNPRNFGRVCRARGVEIL